MEKKPTKSMHHKKYGIIDADSFKSSQDTNPCPTKISELLKTLRSLFPAEKFIITGGLALCKYGLRSIKSLTDIDVILISPTDVAKETVKNLQQTFPADTASSDTATLLGIFIMQDYKIDVFQGENEPTLEIDGFHYATIEHIIGAKKRIGRVKDWIQLRSMARLFCKDEEFTIFLNNIKI